MINLNNVTKIYSSRFKNNEKIALKGVSFNVNQSEFVSLVGKSGSGKTTLLRLILGEEKPTEGKIYFEGTDLTKIKPAHLYKVRRRIGTVFQDYKLFPTKTTRENIAYVMEVMGASDEEINRDVEQILDIVGLKDRADSFPDELSGGERQRVAVARALIHRPDIILADEPTGNLDPYNTLEIVKLLLKIHEMGKTIILATHNKELVNYLRKRVVTLEDGRIIRDEEKGRFIL
ncbi:MAG TPA: ATP-binding cassette domain-containing protein [Candidatus Pacearchaeota archaeon]|nr:ATP-binding cassette domain-containing protein [Candidatus Pacearchaeota archaeon]HOL90605.1 ATP-binding cassette domain-containing protein [Candidatus Pacearchaeota archaeon]HPO68612.1 ATP-binding cassette domain-containing protein [Candidatus Pacearchaeota archaeon]